MKKILLSAITLALGFTINAQIPANGLLVHYDFKGNADDISGNGHHATATDVSYMSSPYGSLDQAVQITPTSTINYDYTAHKTDFETQSYSCVVRAKISSLPNTYTNFLEIGDPSVFSSYFRLIKSAHTYYRLQGGFYNVATNSGSHIESSVSFQTDLMDGRYHYFGIVVDNDLSLLKLYIDGVHVATSTYSGSMNFPTNYSIMHVGGRPATQTFNPDGNIDELLLYDRALQAYEMMEIMQTAPCEGNVYIPNSLLKSDLLDNPAINTNLNGEIECSEARAYTGTLSFVSRNISDFTGLEAFSNATRLIIFNCPVNHQLDLRYNKNLKYVSLNAVNSPGFTKVITTALEQLDTFAVNNNSYLSSIDINTNGNLSYLDTRGSQIHSLDLFANPFLRFLGYTGNGTLHVNNNTQLQTIECNSATFTTINGLENLTALKNVDFSWSQVRNLHFKSPNLLSLNLQNVLLESLNIEDLNASDLQYFSAPKSDNLTCVQVTDVTGFNNLWGSDTWGEDVFDQTLFYSNDCAAFLSIKETEQNNIMKLYPNPVSNRLNVHINEDRAVRVMNVLGKAILTVNLKSGNNIIDVNYLTPGVYFITTDNGANVKFVKE